MASDIDPVETLTRGDAAIELDVALRTIDQWIKGGELVGLKNRLTREVRVTTGSVAAKKAARAAERAVWEPMRKTETAA